MKYRAGFLCLCLLAVAALFLTSCHSPCALKICDKEPLQLENLGKQLSNRQPSLEPLFAEIDGKRVRVIKNGMNVVVRANANDADGDKLRYEWTLAPGAGKLDKNSGSTITWGVGKASGRNDLKLVVYDDRGGWARRHLKINADEGLVFSGRVLTNSGKPVEGAEVEVGENTGTTNSNGFFRILVRNSESERLVMNIKKPGFGLVSRVYDSSMEKGEWRLPAAVTKSVDPTKAILVQGVIAPDDCVGTLSSRFDWSNYPEQAVPRFIESNGQIVVGGFPSQLNDALAALSGGTSCSPGISVSIPPNSLVDEKGNLPSGNVNVSVSTIDLFSPNGMPGDYTVRNKKVSGVMQSSGAGTINVFDDKTTYQLKEGARAKLTLPIDPLELNKFSETIQPTIPLLLYNESTGYWMPQGSAKLNANGDAYVTEVAHFSAWNTDLVKVNQSCVRIDSAAIVGDYTLEVTIPMENGVPVVRTFDVNNTTENIHAIYNLPNNTPIGLVPFRGTVPLGNFGTYTGGPQQPTDPNRPDYPYGACQSQINLFEVGGVNVPAAPSNLSFSFDTLSSGFLSWSDNASNETLYWIYMSTAGEFGPYYALGNLFANTVSEQITELEPCKDAWFKVVASNSSGYSLFSNAVRATTDATAIITISNSFTSPLSGGTYTLGCFDFATFTGSIGKRDANGNNVLDDEAGSNAHVFPRHPELRTDLSGQWDLISGKSMDFSGSDFAEAVLLSRLSTFTTVQRDQFVALYLDINSTSVNPVSMWGGDMVHPANGVFGPEDGIVMNTWSGIPSVPPNLYQLGGYMPTNFGPGYLFGHAAGNMFFPTPDGLIIYGATVDIVFNIPLYNDQ